MKIRDIQILGSCLKTKTFDEYEGDVDNNCNWCVVNGSQRSGKGQGELEPRGRLETILFEACLSRLEF